jgi:hypothetical protein
MEERYTRLRRSSRGLRARRRPRLRLAKRGRRLYNAGAMIARYVGIALGCLLALAGCASERQSRQWMKLDQNYTTEEFRRDHVACTTDKRLDDTCMRSRGWVDVSPSKNEEKTPTDPDARRPSPSYGAQPPTTPPPRR